jgi:hypothetical protein
MERLCCFSACASTERQVQLVHSCLCVCWRVARLSSSSSASRGRALWAAPSWAVPWVPRLFLPRYADLLEVCVGVGCPVARLSSPSSASRRRQLVRISCLTPCPAIAVFDAARFCLCAFACGHNFPRNSRRVSRRTCYPRRGVPRTVSGRSLHWLRSRGPQPRGWGREALAR